MRETMAKNVIDVHETIFSVVFRPMPETMIAWVLSGTEKYSDVFVRFQDGYDAGITQHDGVYLNAINDTTELSLDDLIENYGYDIVEITATAEQIIRIKAYFSDKTEKRITHSCMRTVFGFDLFGCCNSTGLSMTAPELIAGALLWGAVIPSGRCHEPSQLSFTDFYQLLSSL